MIVIRCPSCGEHRTEEELVYGGEAGILRPDPQSATDHEWTEYLHMRRNTKGAFTEQWCCASGCGQWFNVERDTVSHAIGRVFLPG
jgi:sarcosine oxidase subunit delta